MLSLIIAHCRFWRRYLETRLALERLDAHLLADMGLADCNMDALARFAVATPIPLPAAEIAAYLNRDQLDERGTVMRARGTCPDAYRAGWRPDCQS